MKIEQRIWNETSGWDNTEPTELSSSVLVLAFGSRSIVEDNQKYQDLQRFYPNANIVLCSTAGEIMNTEVYDNTLSCTAIEFEKTTYSISNISVFDFDNCFEAGQKIASDLNSADLKNLFIISDGQLVNGSELVKGMNSALSSDVIITGGLAGDSAQFEKTAVGYNTPAKSGTIVGIGFCGDNLTIGHGCIGGWEPFGPQRIITKSIDNTLFELDGKSALDLYKNYLGEQANELPGSALLFPLSIQEKEGANEVVRTILSIDNEQKSMTFAGDVPVGYISRLMKASFDTLINGASGAAQNALGHLNNTKPELAILISCVGRKLVLDHRIEEEVEEVKAILGDESVITGFYSYGEISPFKNSTKCELHNQTMTITTFSEK